MNENKKMDDESKALWDEFWEKIRNERLPSVMEALIAKGMISHFPAESQCCHHLREIIERTGQPDVDLTIHTPAGNLTFEWNYCPTCGRVLRRSWL